MKAFLFAGAVALALCAAACTSSGSLTPPANTDVTDALAIACPVEAAVTAQLAADKIPLSAQAQAAFTLLNGLCPPNPPPTSAVVAAIDIVSAYAVLEPLVAPKAAPAPAAN